MNTQVDWLFIIVIFFSLLGTVISFILYFANRNASFSPRILAFMIFCISYALFGFGLTISNEYLRFPHLWRTPVFMTLCVAPLTFIYVKSVLEQQFTFRKKDFLLFVPAVLYTMQFIPMFLLPTNEKLEIISKALQDKTVNAREPEGMLPEGWGIMFRMVYNFSILIATYFLLIRWKKNMLYSTNYVGQNREIFRWLLFLTIVLSASFFVLFFEFLFQISRYFDLYRLMSVTVSGTLLFICFYLLLKPNILYGLKGWLQYPEPVAQAEPLQEMVPVIQEQKKLTLTVEQGQAFKTIIEKHFQDNSPFLKSGYTISDLYKETGIPTYQLSAFINQEYAKNFNEFINEYRVVHLDNLTRQSSEYRQYTLEALGRMAGFRSRTAFIAAVKKKTNKTPSEFFGKLGEQ